MASNFCKNVAKMQVVGALSEYLLTKSPFVNASIATSTTKTKKAPNKVPFVISLSKQRYLA
ncbi:hypothetical protein BCT92_03325 [Vibrio sp. 10N.261.52.E5]|nr:hypothetical protein BCT92_03325 [Vibrio sp. 10N.261.52.E5]TKF83124.1 hypothetical protein FCV65_13260 [Vibrio sp. F13]TKF91767.1 hypothetical protein FCV73_09085 [Vibrio sp. F13]